MKPEDIGDYRIFGLDPPLFAAYRRALEAGLREDGAAAAEAFAELARAAPDYLPFRYHLASALFAQGRDLEGIAVFRDIQARDELCERFASCDRLLQGEEGPLPEDGPSPYHVSGEGRHSGRFAREFMALDKLGPGARSGAAVVDYMAMAKTGSGSRVYEKAVEGAGVVVFEGLVRKHAGDDECARIEVDVGPAKEAVTFNEGLFVLRSNSAVVRKPILGRFRSFRFVVHRGGSRLYVDGYAVARSDRLPPGGLPRIRFGLFDATERLDTSYFWSSLRICHGLRGGSPDDLAPVPRLEESLSNLAVVLTELGRAEEALDCFVSALEGRPGRDVIHNFEVAGRVLADAWKPSDERLTRCLEVVRLQAGEERAAELRTAIQQKQREVAVSCRNVSVYFARSPHRIVRPAEVVKRLLAPRRYFEQNYWWAVRDVSFDLRYGDVLGIIGDNGAGKSTLLRAIAGMLDHEGSITVAGKTRLLVMGLGIHDELTGAENVLLSGLYLGLRRKVVREKLDSIIEFAGLEAFQNVPYKYYSDGMKARLLFAIATSVEPDIVLLDELLAAGDLSFRTKAMRRMDEIVAHCKAMIVVTHNLSFVRERATRALYLSRGRVVYHGDPNKAVDAYLDDSYRGPGWSAGEREGYLVNEV